MKLNKIVFAAIAATAVALSTTYADTPGSTMAAPSTNSTDTMTALFGDPVIAKGTGISIKRSDLDQIVTGLKAEALARGQEIPPDRLIMIEAEMLERLLDIQVLLQQANAADKAEGDKKAAAAMATLLDRAGGSQDTLNIQLKAAGTTEAELRNKVAQEATAMAALQRLLGITITTNEIQAYYDAHPAEVEQPELAHVRHILFMTMDPATRAPLSTDVVQAKHKEANDVLVKARAGDDFAKLAEQYSDDTTTKAKGGELPPFGRGQGMVPEFEAAAFALTNNQVSDVIQTEYGYHIIKMIDKTPARKLALSDKVPGTTDTVSDRIKDYLTQQKVQQLAPPYLQKLKKADNVTVVDPDLAAAVDSLSNTNAASTATMPPPAAQ
ncbi:MAG TPA: peptidylprolyl isomerase [Pseudomonadales bacterium]|nr:peptidylprolyl isomerase [Pseudomonadales bacterium]